MQQLRAIATFGCIGLAIAWLQLGTAELSAQQGSSGSSGAASSGNQGASGSANQGTQGTQSGAAAQDATDSPANRAEETDRAGAADRDDADAQRDRATDRPAAGTRDRATQDRATQDRATQDRSTQQDRPMQNPAAQDRNLQDRSTQQERGTQDRALQGRGVEERGAQRDSARQNGAQATQGRGAGAEQAGMGWVVDANERGDLTVSSFEETSVFGRAGFMEGDTIVSVNGRTFNSADRLNAFLHSHRGEQLDVIVLRDGERQTLALQVPEAAAYEEGQAFGGRQQGQFGAAQEARNSALGVTLVETRQGIFVDAVYEGSPADEAGLQPGDMIATVGGREFADIFNAAAHIGSHEPGQTLEIGVVRNGEMQQIEAELAEWEVAFEGEPQFFEGRVAGGQLDQGRQFQDGQQFEQGRRFQNGQQFEQGRRFQDGQQFGQTRRFQNGHQLRQGEQFRGQGQQFGAAQRPMIRGQGQMQGQGQAERARMGFRPEGESQEMLQQMQQQIEMLQQEVDRLNQRIERLHPQGGAAAQQGGAIEQGGAIDRGAAPPRPGATDAPNQGLERERGTDDAAPRGANDARID